MPEVRDTLVRRPRPYIPLSVRVQVAERQVSSLMPCIIPAGWWGSYTYEVLSFSQRLSMLLEKLSEALGDVLQLDHDPALILRKFHVDRRKPPAAWFTPNANDPDHLIYRPIREHLQKTTGRKSDAAKTVTTRGSDQWLKSKFNRLEGKTKPRRKQKIPARANPWPKGRKLGQRSPGR